MSSKGQYKQVQVQNKCMWKELKSKGERQQGGNLRGKRELHRKEGFWLGCLDVRHSLT